MTDEKKAFDFDQIKSYLWAGGIAVCLILAVVLWLNKSKRGGTRPVFQQSPAEAEQARVARIERELAEINRLMQQPDEASRADAAARCEALVGSEPQDAELHHVVLSMAAAMKAEALAEKILRSLAEKFPDDPRTYAAQGAYLLNAKGGEGAIDAYRKAAEKARAAKNDAMECEMASLLAQVALRLKQPDIADEVSADLVKRFPENPNSYFLLGKIRLAAHNGEGAVEPLEKAVELIEKNKSQVQWIVRAILAEAYLKQGKTVQADAQLRLAADTNLFETVVSVARASPELAVRLGQVLLVANKKEEAEPAYHLLRQLAWAHPDDADAQYSAALAALRWWGSSQEARGYLDKAKKLKPGDPRFDELQAQLDKVPLTQPASQPATQPASQPATMPGAVPAR